MLTESDKDKGRMAWDLIKDHLDLERLLVMYASAHHQANDEAARAEVVETLPDETVDSIRDKAEFTMELIKDTLKERGITMELLDVQKAH